MSNGAVERSANLSADKDLHGGAGQSGPLRRKKNFQSGPHLNDSERKVLRYLVGDGLDGHFYPFAPIMEHTHLDRGAVRRACRSLKRKGLTAFLAGLWTEDGETAGSGYAATDDGRHWFWNENEGRE